MKITKLEYQKQDPNRVNIFADGKFIAGLEVSDVLQMGLYTGQEITSDQVNNLISRSEFGKLFNSILNFLSYRPRSQWEIRRKLKFQIAKIKTTTQASVLENSIVEKLTKIGQINDEEFIKWYLDQRNTFKPMGKRGIKYELLKRGLTAK